MLPLQAPATASETGSGSWKIFCVFNDARDSQYNQLKRFYGKDDTHTYRRLPATPTDRDEIDTGGDIITKKENLKVGDFIMHNTSTIFKIVEISDQNRVGDFVHAEAELLFRVETDEGKLIAVNAPAGKKEPRHRWYLQLKEKPWLNLISGFPTMTSTEQDAISHLYLSMPQLFFVGFWPNKAGETVLSSPPLRIPFEVDWVILEYYLVSCREPMRALKEEGHRILEVVCKLSGMTDITFQTLNTNLRLQLPLADGPYQVMAPDGMIFEVTPTAIYAVAIFDPEKCTIETLLLNRCRWKLRSGSHPVLEPDGFTGKLTVTENKMLSFHYGMTPTKLRGQIFATDCGFAPAAQAEDFPGSGIFGPKLEYTGYFTRRGLQFYQQGLDPQLENKIAYRYQLSETRNTGWLVSYNKNQWFWLAADPAVKVKRMKSTRARGKILYAPTKLVGEYAVCPLREYGYGSDVWVKYLPHSGLQELSEIPNADYETDYDEDPPVVLGPDANDPRENLSKQFRTLSSGSEISHQPPKKMQKTECRSPNTSFEIEYQPPKKMLKVKETPAKAVVCDAIGQEVAEEGGEERDADGDGGDRRAAPGGNVGEGVLNGPDGGNAVNDCGQESQAADESESEPSTPSFVGVGHSPVRNQAVMTEESSD